MNIKLLKEIFKENSIPEDATIMSDSGWECCATTIGGVFYSPSENVVVLTQGGAHDIYYGYRGLNHRYNEEINDYILYYIPDEDIVEYLDYVKNEIYDSEKELKVSNSILLRIAAYKERRSIE